MKKTILLSLIILSISKLSIAQEPVLKLSSERKTDNSVDINYTKNDVGSYFVVASFTNLTNCFDPEIQKKEVVGSSGKLTTLKPSNPSQGIGFSYTYRYIRGTSNFKNTNFVYIFPFEKDTKVSVYESTYLKATYFGKITPPDWKCYRFYTDKETKIVAARKGIVVQVINDFSLDSAKSYSFKQDNNELVIEHNDGSLARYNGFKKGSIMVKVGQTVYPETVLGINSKYSADDKRYSLSFYIYYLKPDVFIKQMKNPEQEFSVYGFITPIIFTKNGQSVLVPNQDYLADSNNEIIIKEFTKKELKQLQEK